MVTVLPLKLGASAAPAGRASAALPKTKVARPKVARPMRNRVIRRLRACRSNNSGSIRGADAILAGPKKIADPDGAARPRANRLAPLRLESKETHGQDRIPLPVEQSPGVAACGRRGPRLG